MAQTMQAYIANALEMRKQNAAAAQFRAQMQAAQYDRMSNAIASAGKGLGQVFGGGLSRLDRTTNQFYNTQNPPRAMAVNPKAPGVAVANEEFGPRTSPLTGGVAELKMRQSMEDQTAQRQAQGSLIDARIARLNLAQAGSERADDVLLLRQQAAARQAELDEQKSELALVEKARKDFANTTKQYQGLVANAKGYTSQMTVALKALGHAKTPEEHQAAADAIQAHYQAGIGTGLKVAEPVVRPFVDDVQRSEILRQEQQLKAASTGVTTDAIPNWLQWPAFLTGKAESERQAAQGLEALKSRPGYTEAQPGYTPPEQPAGIFPAIPPAPEIPAILGGTGPNPTPSQAVGGTASGGGGSMATVPLADALKVDPNATVGKIMTDKYGNKARVGP